MTDSGEAARLVVLRLTAIAALAVWPAAAMSQMAIDASATGQYESNSNVYALPAGVSFPSPDGFHRSDALYSYAGKIGLIEQWHRQKIFATVNATSIHYNSFTQLNHSEYALDGGWNWVATSAFDGTLEATRSRSMVSFTDVIQSQLALQTDQREIASVAIHVSPDWDVDGKGYRRTLDEPLPGSPNLRLTETQGQTGLKYVGRAGVTSGVSASYLSGHFDGSGNSINPSYHETGMALFATVGTQDRPVFNGRIGYSRRGSSSGINTISGLTGSADYYRPLSGKTSLILTASRAINSYVTNTGSEIDTLGGITLKYQATYKTGFSANYLYTHRTLPDQGLTANTARTDNVQYVAVGIDYEALEWLSIKPYVNLQTRSSNVPFAEFNATVYGVYFSLKWVR